MTIVRLRQLLAVGTAGYLGGGALFAGMRGSRAGGRSFAYVCRQPDRRFPEHLSGIGSLPRIPLRSDHPHSEDFMKMKLTKRRKRLLGCSLLLLTATPSFALFGFGDIVFDPSSYASLVSQLTTLQTQYTMLKNNIEHFSFKQQWQTTLTALKNTNIRNMFGETSGMTTAFNSDSPSASTTGWTSATVPVTSDAASYLQSEAPRSAHLSQLAMIEMSDSVSPDCITAVGQYRSARLQNAAANNSLAANQLDGSSATNSEVQQLNLLNAAEAQKMAEMQNQGTLQACLASQMAVANMERRNAAATDLNTAVFVQTQHATHDMSATSEDNTWQTYLP